MHVADELAVRKEMYSVSAGNYSEVGQGPTKGAMHMVRCVYVRTMNLATTSIGNGNQTMKLWTP
jgi:hypothetical protein